MAAAPEITSDSALAEALPALSPALRHALLEPAPRGLAAVQAICPSRPSIGRKLLIGVPAVGVALTFLLIIATAVSLEPLFAAFGMLLLILSFVVFLALAAARLLESAASSRERALARLGTLFVGEVTFVREDSEHLHDVAVAFTDQRGIARRTGANGGGGMTRLRVGMRVPILAHGDEAGIVVEGSGLFVPS